MSDFNSQHNRVVWVDIPVADLERAMGFYTALLAVKVHAETFGAYRFAVLDHQDGNGGCLVPGQPAAGGVLIYLNVDGRIRHAVSQVEAHGGKIEEPIRSLGPHGFRAIVIDSEGNRIALHSNTDA